MSREAIIEHTVSVLNMLPEEKAMEVADFADFMMHRQHQQNGSSDPDRTDWLASSLTHLASCYDDDEPDYSDAVIIEHNPHYQPE